MLLSSADEGTSLEGAEAAVEVVSTEPVEPEPEAAVEPEPAGDDAPFPLAEPGDYYVGLWCGIPNYGCPYCGFATLDGSGAVELHILEKVDQSNPRHMKAMNLKEVS